MGMSENKKAVILELEEEVQKLKNLLQETREKIKATKDDAKAKQISFYSKALTFHNEKVNLTVNDQIRFSYMVSCADGSQYNFYGKWTFDENLFPEVGGFDRYSMISTNKKHRFYNKASKKSIALFEMHQAELLSIIVKFIQENMDNTKELKEKTILSSEYKKILKEYRDIEYEVGKSISQIDLAIKFLQTESKTNEFETRLDKIKK